jgi:hypothetical protein
MTNWASSSRKKKGNFDRGGVWLAYTSLMNWTKEKILKRKKREDDVSKV